jgi:hypothetical protein
MQPAKRPYSSNEVRLSVLAEAPMWRRLRGEAVHADIDRLASPSVLLLSQFMYAQVEPDLYDYTQGGNAMYDLVLDLSQTLETGLQQTRLATWLKKRKPSLLGKLAKAHKPRRRHRLLRITAGRIVPWQRGEERRHLMLARPCTNRLRTHPCGRRVVPVCLHRAPIARAGRFTICARFHVHLDLTNREARRPSAREGRFAAACERHKSRPIDSLEGGRRQGRCLGLR